MKTNRAAEQEYRTKAYHTHTHYKNGGKKNCHEGD